MSDHSDDSDSSDEEWSLWDELHTGSCRSMFPTTPHRFVPEGFVNRAVNFEAVRLTLNIGVPSTIDQTLLNFIVSRAKKAFAIAVYARVNNVRKAMEWFMNKGIDDSNLPVKVQTPRWQAKWRGVFFDHQWRFFAPVFVTTDHRNDFEEFFILPFTSVSLVSDEGAFGEVSEAVIHQDHMKPDLINGGRFALKKIKAQSDTEEVAQHWESEVKALRMMNELDQEHIVRFITAFRRLNKIGEEHYVMFEWAGGGNLRRMWKATPSPELTGNLVKLVVEQLLGLATALSAAHNLQSPGSSGASYRHGDLKPENILVFPNDNPVGTLKIGDWGEAKYQGKVTAIRPSRTTTKFGTRRYEAPEVEIGLKTAWLGQSERRRSRLGDIWAMGCITLEFIVWLLYGLKGLEKFNNDVFGETFYQVSIVNGKKAAQVHVAVVRWMERISKEPACAVGTTALGDLLEFVQTQLLVVNLPPRLGQTFDVNLERQRTNSFDDPCSAQTSSTFQPPEIETLTIFEEPAVANNPTFTLTPAETNGSTNDDRTPIPSEPGTNGPTRCHAVVFKDKLYDIITTEDSNYWDTKQLLQGPLDLAYADDELSLTETIQSSDEYKRGDYASPELDDNQWKLSLDNYAAVRMFTALQNFQEGRPGPRGPSALCDACKDFCAELRVAGFVKSYEVADLRVRASTSRCTLCQLLWQVCKSSEPQDQVTARFERDRAFLKLNGAHNAALTLVREPMSGIPPSSDCQIGFVELPAAGSLVHLQLIKHWLHECNELHSCKPQVASDGSNGRPRTRLPTRLIDVGLSCDETVHLWETGPSDGGEWIALSHRWGRRNFSTTSENLQQHIGQGLSVAELPDTFRDAVIVTRALGKRYLWIDSLCIIQGDDGDFQTEAMRMADVYSGAYCVLAASCAADHYDGFLKARSPRQYVTIAHEGYNYYICETIDNFKKHVLDGALNLRGWVLQEHALARRTIFFTEHQTYFECRDGVRCESSTKLKNEFAKFLGDSDFPDHLLQAKRGEKINRINKLYMDYSRLGFSKPHDRPVAIDGLQQKLMETTNVRGEFGVIEDPENPGWFRRSLLWRRGSRDLKPIVFPTKGAASRVPSWSWMAYDGGIDYHRPDFGFYDWEDITSPWPRTEGQPCDNALVAKVWKYDLESAGQGESEVVFDDTHALYSISGTCVVLGKATGIWEHETRRHWVLIVTPTTISSCEAASAYKRIGSGYIPGRCLSRKFHKEQAHIH